MATVALEGIHFFAYHGFYEEERLVGNHFVVDLYIETRIGRAAAGDDLYATVNYETAYFICQAEMRKPTRLLESLAQRIADRLRDQFEKAREVRVRVRKMAPPLGGHVDSAFVECTAGSSSEGLGGGEDTLDISRFRL